MIKPLPLPQPNTGKETATTTEHTENVTKPFPPANGGKTGNSATQKPIIKPMPLPNTNTNGGKT